MHQFVDCLLPAKQTFEIHSIETPKEYLFKKYSHCTHINISLSEKGLVTFNEM